MCGITDSALGASVAERRDRAPAGQAECVMLSSHNFKIVIIGFAAALLTFLVITSIATELRINKGPRCAVPLTTFCQNLKLIEE